MLKKNKKFTLLLSGLSGVLLTSSIAGVALSSCSTTSSSTSSDVQYSYVIDWNNKDAVDRLIIDDSGLVYSDNSKTTVIAVSPKVKLATVKIPSTVKSIMGYSRVMYQKISDQSIVDQIPTGGNESDYTKVYQSYGAFQNMVSLETVILESGSQLQSIGGLAFSGCTTLKTISGLSSSLDYIGTSAFNNCINLTSIDTTNVVKVGDNAFLNCNKLGSVNLSSVVYIGNNAFQNCSSLSSVDFSKNTALTSIGYAAFMGAMSSGSTTVKIDLSNVTLLRSIPNSAFQGCTNLGSVVLSSSNNLVAIGTNAFNGATSLSQVGSTTNTFTAPSLLGNYTVDETTSYVTSGIGAYAFSGTQITTIDLSAATIATTPFTNATFKNMTSLANVSFGSSSKITTLPYSLFENDSALTSLTLPSSITTLNDGKNNTTEDTTDEDTSRATYVDSRSPFYNSGLTSIDMTNIASYNTGNVTVGTTYEMDATTIVPYALFQGLTNLKTVYLKTGTVSINSYAFDGATSLTTVKEGNSLTNATDGDGFLIPSTLAWTGYYAFKGTGIKSIAFANALVEGATNSLWFLGQGTFQDATALTSVNLAQADLTNSHTIPASDAGTGSQQEEGVGLFAISSSLFSGATALTSVVLPTSVTKIFSSAFVNNTSLATVNFENLTSLIEIQTNNFNNTLLTNIDFSNITNSSTISELSNSFTNGESSIFTGLQSSAIVKLPASMNLISGLSNTVFTTTESTTSNVVHASINYPSGITLQINTTSSVYYIGSGSSSITSQYSNPMLKYVSGALDLTTTTENASIAKYYGHTFFGNTKLTSLTLSASKLSSGDDSSPAQSQTLFMSRTTGGSGSSTVNYNSSFIPFGGNTALTDFVFTNFDVDPNPSYPSLESRAENDANPLYKTTSKTWAQVGTIINKFAGNSLITVADWTAITTAGDPADDTSKIQYDSSITTSSNSDGYTVSITDVYNIGETSGASQTIATQFTNSLGNNDKKTLSFVHNGVTWTLTIVPKTNTTEGSVTLVGTNINIYKATNDNATVKKQIPFDNTYAADGTTPSKKITVTLKIV